MNLLVIQTAALGYQLWEKYHKAEFWQSLAPQSVDTVFPAVTCTVQASFRTGTMPFQHGMIANGLFDRALSKAMFWEQCSGLYEGGRIWDEFRAAGGTVGQICWQQSLGTDADMILSPAPIHKHHGGMIQDFYAKPADLYKRLCAKLGRKFDLRTYWGPFTSLKSSQWIADATCELLSSGQAPNLLLTYLPHLDYELQRTGPEGPGTEKIFRETELLIEQLFVSARTAGYDVVVFGDYAITQATHGVVFPNRLLRDAGFFSIREVNGMHYPDIYSSRAFAMVDHQVAHVYVPDQADIVAVRGCLENQAGVGKVLDHSELNHPCSGELILQAAPGFWFAYPWWLPSEKAPDYASHVDIHNKPGFDPCELLMKWWPPMAVPQTPEMIGGTHGLACTPETAVVWGSTLDSCLTLDSVVEGAKMIRSRLAGGAV